MVLQRLKDSARSRLAPQLWRALRPQWQLPSGVRVDIESFAEWVIYNDIFVDGEYDLPIREVVARDQQNPVILDIGANVGFFALRFADQWMRKRPGDAFRLIGIEGSPRTYAKLQSRLSQAGLSSKVEVHLGLAGKRQGEARITTSEFHVTDTIMASSNSGQSTAVKFIDLTAIVPSGRISLVKCDIEGAEQLFIENYPDLLARTDFAIFEFHHEICDVEKCVNLLQAAGLSHVQQIRDCRPTVTVDFFANAGTGHD